MGRLTSEEARSLIAAQPCRETPVPRRSDTRVSYRKPVRTRYRGSVDTSTVTVRMAGADAPVVGDTLSRNVFAARRTVPSARPAMALPLMDAVGIPRPADRQHMAVRKPKRNRV